MTIEENILLPVFQKTAGAFGVIDAKIRNYYLASFKRRRVLKDETGYRKADYSLDPEELLNVSMERIYVSRVKFVVMLNPTMEMDVRIKSQFFQKCRELQKENVGVILVGSNISDLKKICDRMIIVKKGISAVEIGKEELDRADFPQLL